MLVSAVAGRPACTSAPAQSAASFGLFMASPNWLRPAPTGGIHVSVWETAGFRAVPDCTARPPFQQIRLDGEMSECASFEHADDASGVRNLGCRLRHYIFGRSLGIITARTRGPL